MANQVTITFTGKIKDLQDKLKKVGSSMDKTRDKVKSSSGRIAGAFDGVGSKLGGLIKTAGKAAAALGAVGGVALVKVGHELLSTADAASDLNEAMSKVDTVFGASSGTIRAWAETAATTIGLSERAALDAAGSFGNMFDQLGIGSKASQEMSMQITGLAADFASFHNADISEVIEAQSAAFRGEYDALQQFLPLINAASVEQRALELSGKGATSELTQQDKALATHALMLEGAGDAMGDFARTADGMANSERIAQAQMENMRAEIGQKMIPISMKLTRLKLKLAGVFADKVAPAIGKVTGWLSDNRATFAAVGAVIVGTVIPALRTFAEGVGARLQAAVAWIVEHKDTWIAIGSAIAAVAVPALTLAADAIAKVTANKDALLAIGIGVAAVLVPSFYAWAVAAGAAAISTIAAAAPLILIGAAVAALAYLIITNWDWIKEKTAWLWEWVTTATSAAWEWLKSAATATWDFVKQVFGSAADTLTGHINMIWSIITTVWNVIKAVTSATWNFIAAVIGNAVSTVSGHVNLMKAIVTGVWNVIRAVTTAVWGGIRSSITTQINLVTGVFRRFRAITSSIFSAIGRAITAPIRAALSGIRSAWNSTIGGKGISIPSIMGFGGANFTIPRLAEGGIAKARPGGHLVNVAEGGQDEAIIPLGRGGMMPGQPMVLEIRSGGSQLDDLMVELIRKAARNRGGIPEVVSG